MDINCDNLVDFWQCMTDRLELGCFWLYDSASGTTGECRAKTNTSLTCGDAKTISQCTLDDVDEFGTKCFWLYDSASGATGVCQTKTNTSLTCGDAKTAGQCTWGEVTEFGKNCVWLEGNVIGETYTEAQCMKRVCLSLHLWYYVVWIV
jgi:hypothetical protein